MPHDYQIKQTAQFPEHTAVPKARLCPEEIMTLV